MDFMSDALNYRHRFRTLNVLDDYNRQLLTIEVDTSLTADWAIRVPERLIAWLGKPNQIRVDNGPEITSSALESWATEKCIKLEFIKPGSPNQYGLITAIEKKYWIYIYLSHCCRFVTLQMNG
ncbi:DDE-type integrase/transposase/recombinase [Pseudoalteromonas sp. Of7M-16]|uniref:DDE-type integrase/transposase/recombinase n=1 Tax=Pseudoalteromonas sp. Of7M-16 TaxID=2917756 RepID=UPI0023B7F0DF|nr:DDE-type integrase/transposase/recombinase [Pseudoalteromonas sp. Of7M-16]